MSGSATVKSIAERELESGVIFGARNRTRQVNIKSVLIPFGFDPSNSLLVEVDRAVIVASGSRRSLYSATWAHDANFADNGVMTVCIPSIDEEAVATAAGLIAEEIKAHLAFERVAHFA